MNNYSGNKLIKNFKMVITYFKIAFRNIIKQPVYSIISIIGLAIGMMCFILIMLWVKNELSYDVQNESSSRTYRISVKAKLDGKVINSSQTGAYVSKGLMNDFPEVETATTIFNFNKSLVEDASKISFELKVLGSDPNFIKVFNISSLQGDTRLLDEPNTAIITEETASKFFGKENPVGKILSFSIDREFKKFTVVAVVKEMPVNSHFHFDLVFSLSSLSWLRQAHADWMNSDYCTYIVLRKDADFREFEIKLNNYLAIQITPILKAWKNVTLNKWNESGNYWKFILQPLKKIHLYSSMENEFEQNGEILYVYLFASIALLVLIVSCINYANLSLIKSNKRIKEVTLRKIYGSSKSSLVLQFCSEDYLFCFLSLFAGLILVETVLPFFRNFTGKSIFINYIKDGYMIPSLLLFSVLVNVFAGLYPSLYLAGYSPGNGFVMRHNSRNPGFSFKNILVILQFTVTIIVLIGAIIISRQLDYMQNEKLGFDKRNIIVIHNTSDLGFKNQETLKEKLLKHPAILTAAYSERIPGEEVFQRTYSVSGENNPVTHSLEVLPCDHDFLKTFKFELTDGTFFPNEFSNKSRKIIVNEKALKELNYKDYIGKRLVMENAGYEIIGVIKDFHCNSKRNEIQPMGLVEIPDVFAWWPPIYLSLRINPRDKTSTLNYIQKEWQSLMPGKPFIYSFFDEDYNSLYNTEEQTKKLFYIFSILVILISCLGLIGFVGFIADRRTIEIGIRKVNGANSSEIILMLSKDFARWVAIAFIIACPIAYFVMNKWLQNFAYKTSLSWWIFLLAGSITFIIALVTTSWQSWKAANKNPVEALRYE